MLKRLTSAIRAWWRPSETAAEAFLRDHPHLGMGNARRVLADVNGTISRGECARTVDAIAMRIRFAFPDWFFDDVDATRHAAAVLHLDVSPEDAGSDLPPG